jgi:rRNA maturation RNase YbeY
LNSSESPIQFHNEGIDFALPNPERSRQWLLYVIDQESFTIENLNYIFCSDEHLYQMNVQFLNHDTLTDVITFPYATEHVEGDIFISVDRTSDNAKSFGVSPNHELNRVMVHGLLHLLGYKDKTDEDQELMTDKENHYLALWNKLQAS